MIIYVESIFLDNFLPNTLLLYLASPLRKRQRLLRSAAGGAFGGVYAVFAAYFPVLSSFWFKLPIGCLLCIISYGFRNQLFRGCLSFFAASFLMGGINLALLYALPLPSSALRITQRLLFGSSFVTVCIISLIKRLQPKPTTEPITFILDQHGEPLTFTAEYDSGMNLCDERGYSVLLLDRDYAKVQLSEDTFNELAQTADRPFHFRTAAGSETLTGKRYQLKADINGISHIADAYLLLGENIHLNGSPALYGGRLNLEEINQ